MGGPIVRTGTTPKFWENYDRIFGGTPSKKAASKKEVTKAEAKAETKSVKKGAAKKAAAKKKK